MARTNMHSTRIAPESDGLLTLRVLRRTRLSPGFVRVTVGEGDIERFRFLGFDQWFRLFIPTTDASLARLPNKLDTLAYLRFLTIAKTDRPVLRNYTVRAFRERGASGRPEIDIDFVVHGSVADGTAGPAASWAQSCRAGDVVAIIDEGISYNPAPARAGTTLLVADETAMPAAAGILSSLPRGTRGRALLEIAHADDVQELDGPEAVEVSWIVRSAGEVPGVAALAAAVAAPLPEGMFTAWVAGEQSLATGVRRHWVRAGVPKEAISFTGYWRAAPHR